MSDKPLIIGPETPTAVLGTFRNTTEARLVQGTLQAAGIGAAVVGGPIGDFHPQFTGGAGAGVQVLVREDDLERARKHLPDSALGRPDEVARLDQQFKRGLLRFAILVLILSLVTAIAATALGDPGLYGGIGLSVVAVMTWVFRNVDPNDEEGDDPGAPPGGTTPG